MHIGKRLLIRYEGKVQEGSVIDISQDDLNIRLDDGTIISKKFWEVRSLPNEE